MSTGSILDIRMLGRSWDIIVLTSNGMMKVTEMSLKGFESKRRERDLKPEFSPTSPITGPRCPEGSRKLRFPDYVTTAQDGVKVVSPKHRPPLPPRNTSGTHSC